MLIIDFIKDIIAPKKCYSCKKEGTFFCPQCLSTLSIIKPYCYVCKAESSYFSVHNDCLQSVYYDKIIILQHYKNNIFSKLIKDMKFYKKKDIAKDLSIYLGNKFIENISDLWVSKKDMIFIPTPMFFLKKIFRWYNDAEILALHLSRYLKIDIEYNLIKKIKHTRQQSKLSRQDRLINLEKAFKIDKNILDKLDKKVFIIVDDVVSTWTTINEIAKLLKRVWVEKVIWLALASN